MRWDLAIAACAAWMIAFAPAAADDRRGFVRLQIDGYALSWTAKAAGQPVTLTWALVGGEHETPDARNCRRIGPAGRLFERFGESVLRQEITQAFEYWQRAANIRFRPSEDWREADILIGAQLAPSGIAFANVSFQPGPGAGVGRITRSLICLNPEAKWKIGFDGNLRSHDLRFVVAHEIGHAIGLDHPGPSGQLMSFRYEERFSGLQGGDVAGAVAIYGPAQQQQHAGNRHVQDELVQDGPVRGGHVRDEMVRDELLKTEPRQDVDDHSTPVAGMTPLTP